MSGFARRKWINFQELRSCLLSWLYYSVMLLPVVIFASGSPSQPPLLTVADLQKVVGEGGRVIQSFRIEGWVRAVMREQQTMVVEDSSGAALFELPVIKDPLRAGDRVEIEGDKCLLVRTHFRICIGTAPVVKNEGPHLPVCVSGSVFLEAGLQPIRMEWYVRPGSRVLNLGYEGADVPRQEIPGEVLCRKVAGIEGEQSIQKGLNILTKPSYHGSSPVTAVASNFNVSSRMLYDADSLLLNGYLKIARSGVYKFYLESSGISALWVGEPSVRCDAVDAKGQTMPGPATFKQASAGPNALQWIEVEGDVAFTGINRRSLEIELIEEETQDHIPITIAEGETLFPTNLIHRHIRVSGISEFSNRKCEGIIVPSPKQMQILSLTKESIEPHSTNELLTTTAQVRRLKSEQASMRIPVKIKGVLISAFIEALVLQDSSGGVFVHINPTNLVDKPEIGELWEIEGTSDPGEFSPVVFASRAKYLGNAALPERVHPTWNQLMNGNLDAEYVELRGVLSMLSSNQITLLTPDGKVTIDGDEWLKLPQMPPASANNPTLVGSLVRLRGCYTAKWNMQTRQVIGGVFYLWPGMMAVEEPAPKDPFLLATKKVSDLLWFDAGPSTLERTKIAGQIIYTLPGEYFILDHQTGARILTDQVVSLRIGDLVEAVGFPKLGGPSPIMLESQIRRIGFDHLPEAKTIPPKELLDWHHDSTLVQVRAVLVNEIIHKDELVLEMQAGRSLFAARLRSMPASWPALSAGSMLELTGVYASADETGPNLSPFELLLKDPFEIRILQRPSWWTVRHSITVAASLGGALGITFLWITLLQSIVKKRTAELHKTERFRIMEQERIRIARDLHDELGAGLTEVGMLGALATNQAIPPKDKEYYLSQLLDSIRSLVTGLDEIVWAINPRYDSVESLVTYYSLFAQRFLNLAGIACRLQVVEPFPECPFDSKFRHEVFLAFKEALNNVVRHSQAKETEIKMEVAENHLVISICDNGRGGAAVASAGQDGLAGMHGRLRQLGGTCHIICQPAGGTTVEFRIPLDQSHYD